MTRSTMCAPIGRRVATWVCAVLVIMTAGRPRRMRERRNNRGSDNIEPARPTATLSVVAMRAYAGGWLAGEPGFGVGTAAEGPVTRHAWPEACRRRRLCRRIASSGPYGGFVRGTGGMRAAAASDGL